MNVLKKMTGMILAVCLMVPILGTVVFAADGELQFTDPSAKVGDNVSVDLVVRTDSGTVGNVDISMSYDPQVMEFVSGNGFTADGTGVLEYTGTGSSGELRATAQFKALKAADASLTVTGYTALLSTGETLNLTEGSSAVTIAAADDGTTSIESSSAAGAGETTGITVSVNGSDYSFSEAFTTADIPEGFSEAKMTFNGEERKFVSNDAGIYLGYLVDDSGEGKFFLFDTDNATFLPYTQLNISSMTSIILLDEADAVSLPDNYQQVELTVQDQQFPAWADPSADRYYMIYALNTRTGEKELFQYDTEDGTYQHVEVKETADEEKTADQAIPGKFGSFISDHILPVFVFCIIVILLLLVLMIIFAIKLVHRNQELDDLYDEYDIPLDDDEREEEEQEDSSDDEYEDEYEYEYDDEYDDDYDDDYDDEYEDDEYETGLDSNTKKAEKKQQTEDYNIDFIDL